MKSTSDNAITVRRMVFDYTPEMELVFIDSDPDLSAYFLGTWFLLPYLEPYLMRTVRAAMDATADPVLKQSMKQFCAQEGQHYKQHAQANETILARCRPGPELESLRTAMADIEAEYRGFTENKSLAFNLAYAEGFEAYTCAGSRAQLEHRAFDYMHDPIRDLMLWHIMEEVEHRTVAFDAYEHIVGKYFYRVKIGWWTQQHLISRGTRLTNALKACMPEVFGQAYSEETVKLRKRRTRRLLRATLPKVLNTYLPWYSPHKIRLPAMYAEARAYYSDTALSVS